MRKKHDDAFKARVALEAFKGQTTITELAGKHQVHPNMVTKWKSHLLENATDIFSKKKDGQANDHEKQIDELYKQIGQLKVENDFLKKKSSILNGL